MTINVSPEVEKSILAAVESGRFRSVDEAVTAAWLEWKRKNKAVPPPEANSGAASPDPILGLMRDDAELMDEIVADAYRQRREETWRELDP